MVVGVYVYGGLGNQLFQIFACITYAITVKQTFIFNYWPSSNMSQLSRNLGTGYFDSFLKPLKIYTTFSHSEKLNIQNKNILLTFPKYQEDTHNNKSYEKIPYFENTNGIFLIGSFQSHKYFELEFSNILKLINFKQQQAKVLNDYFNYFSDGFITIGMHFRLGDYKYATNGFKILNYEYYENALIHILIELLKRENNKNNLRNVIFKIRILCFWEHYDDEDNRYATGIINRLQNAIQYISIDEYLNIKSIEIEFIKVSDYIVDWKQLLLMSLCEHIIIANSTFSWWAAYLNSFIEKIITYPFPFHGELDTVDRRDMFPSTWKPIQYLHT